ncbi:MAG TPA: NAD(P)-dependent alcohol dehydrogenase [Candidatus Dormibacteraeota bacterium]|nr:NAD(P)-dependent alcohol dehydrogenase [Candidatus Dormibacteraeota bacterium]
MSTAQVATSMKGYLCDKPASLSALRLRDIPTPAVPDDGLLVRVRGSSANPANLFDPTFAGYLMRGRKPKVLGTDFAGVVEAVGRDVTEFHPGDAVFGGGEGAFAEYLCVRESKAVAMKPASVSFEDAGVVAIAGCTALQAVRDHGQLQAGQSVLINGASGGVGTFAVQVARALGGHVTAVCSTPNIDIARSIGAETVIDYTKSDFTRSPSRYDVIVDIAGSHSFRSCTRVLSPDGVYVLVGAAAMQRGRAGVLGAIGHLIGVRITSFGSRHRVAQFIAKLKKDDMAFLGKLMADGQLKPVIDARYSLEQVPEALQLQQQLHARGKIAIDFARK